MKKLLLMLGALSLVLTLSACGEKGGEVVDPGPTTRTFVAGNTSFAGEFIKGWGNSAYDNNVRKLVDGGVGLFTPNKQGELVESAYVDSYELNSIPNPSYTEGGENPAELQEWTFNLKKGIKFSDGHELTANDVAFTYYMYADPSFISAKGSPSYQPKFIYGFEEYYAAAEAGNIDKSLLGIEVVNDYQIKFLVEESIFTIKSEFAYYTYAEHQFAPDGKIDVQWIKDNLMNKPLGVGPYMITEWNPEQNVKLAINPYYTGNIYGEKPEIENIVVQVVPTETDIDMLLTGEVDLLAGVIEDPKIDAARNSDNLAYSNYKRHGYGYINWHMDYGVMADPEVRKAVAYAFDKPTFVKLMTGKYGTQVSAPYSPHFWMVDEEWLEENMEMYDYNPAKAKEVLEAAGYTLGSDGIYAKGDQKLIINIANGGSPWGDYLNQTLANSVKDSGIKFNIETVDFSILLDHLYGRVAPTERRYHGFALATTFNAEFDGHANYHTDNLLPFGDGASSNQSRWDNEKNDELLMTMRNANPGNDEGRAEYQKAYRDWLILANNENPILPLYANDYHDLYNADLENFKTGPLWDWTYAIVEANWA